MSIIINEYSYIYIKLSGLRNFVIEDFLYEDFEKIKNIQELINFISPYFPNVNFISFTIEEIENQLFNSFFKIIAKIFLSSPRNIREFLRSYILKFEIDNIKQIILGIILQMSKEEIKQNINFVVEDYLEHREFIEKLVEITNLDEIQFLMRETHYNQIIREGIIYFKKTNEIFVLESFLDKFYFENLKIQKKKLKKAEERIIGAFIDFNIELYNINLLYRGNKNKINKDLLEQFIVPHKFFFNEGHLNHLLNIEDPNQFLKYVNNQLSKNQDLKKDFQEISPNNSNPIVTIKNLYRNHFFNKFKHLIDIKDSSIYQILKLLIKKEMEIEKIIKKTVQILHQLG